MCSENNVNTIKTAIFNHWFRTAWGIFFRMLVNEYIFARKIFMHFMNCFRKLE